MAFARNCLPSVCFDPTKHPPWACSWNGSWTGQHGRRMSISWQGHFLAASLGPYGRHPSKNGFDYFRPKFTLCSPNCWSSMITSTCLIFLPFSFGCFVAAVLLLLLLLLSFVLSSKLTKLMALCSARGDNFGATFEDCFGAFAAVFEVPFGLPGTCNCWAEQELLRISCKRLEAILKGHSASEWMEWFGPRNWIIEWRRIAQPWPWDCAGGLWVANGMGISGHRLDGEWEGLMANGGVKWTRAGRRQLFFLRAKQRDTFASQWRIMAKD